MSGPSDPFKPSIPLLVKLGSLIVHQEEFAETGHPFDKAAVDSLSGDVEIRSWLRDMNALAMLPVKRNTPAKPATEPK